MGRNAGMNTWTGMLMLTGAACTLGACGIAVRRDLSNTPPQHVIYDDMCRLQEYHDTMALKQAEPPQVVDTNELESTAGRRRSGGRTTFAFETPFQLQMLRKVLRENWKRLPDDLAKSDRVAVNVRWSEKAGVRRVVTNESASLAYGRETHELPYHICLSELLFGAPLYQTRRELLGLSPLPSLPLLPAGPTRSDSSPAPVPVPPTPHAPSGEAPVQVEPVQVHPEGPADETDRPDPQ